MGKRAHLTLGVGEGRCCNARRRRLVELPPSRHVAAQLEAIGTGRTQPAAVAASMRDLAADGVAVPALCEWARVHVGDGRNAERDLLRWTRGLWGMHVEPCWLRVTLRTVVGPHAGMDEAAMLPIFAPHELFHAIWCKSPVLFRKICLGDADPQCIFEHWENLLQAGGADHPAFRESEHLDRAIPVLVHYDGCESYTNKESHCFSICSALATGHPLDVLLPLCVVMEDRLPTSQLKEALIREIARFCWWSFAAGRAGRMPITDVRGVHHVQGSIAARCAGQDVAGPYRILFGGLMGDRKGSLIQNLWPWWWQCREVCEKCLAVKAPFGEHPLSYEHLPAHNAPWLSTLQSRATYVARVRATPGGRLSPWLGVGGSSLGSCLEDLLHNCYLGHARDATASALAEILQEGLLGNAGPRRGHRRCRADDLRLVDLTHEWRRWCHAEGLKRPRVRLSLRALGWGERQTADIPRAPELLEGRGRPIPHWLHSSDTAAVAEQLPPLLAAQQMLVGSAGLPPCLRHSRADHDSCRAKAGRPRGPGVLGCLPAFGPGGAGRGAVHPAQASLLRAHASAGGGTGLEPQV